MTTTRILGIDPGSRITGYGIIDVQRQRHHYVASGCIRLTSTHTAKKLQQIFSALTELIQQYLPHEAAIEQIFMHRNPGSALKLGQARGAAIVAAAHYGLEIAEYGARHIKQAVVGFGAAKKEQVQHMVGALLALNGLPQADAADALAVAICHANNSALLNSFSREREKVSRSDE